MLSVTNLCVAYPDGNRAIEGVSFVLNDGERVALLGANGAGKSTLFRSIMGLMPMSGEIAADGVTLSKSTVQEMRRKVGIVFQNPDDQLFMTKVRDDVAFGPRNMKLPEDEIERRVNSALSQLNALCLKDRVSDKISVGEKRIAGIASVLSMKPSVLLLDEPSSSLDPRSRRVLIEALRSLPQTILVATHDLDLAKKLCSRVIVLKEGRLCAEGRPDEIISDEASLERFGLY
ncbi:MAG: energy-coupling factor ABC transporter ATP-binding protein [Synergistaceae bacterium]|jgi:cobalt/nickel transport system ATP-binding protein|nr:energy-coupling factor ABC transporter ATP-binding protein [Synergistaceae bacterium]